MTTTHTLTDVHATMLRASAVAEEVAAERPYLSIAPGAVHDVQQLPGSAQHSERMLRTVLHEGALIFSLHRLGDPRPAAWVLRPNQPRTNDAGKVIKYEYPRGCSNLLDVLPRYRDALGDPATPLMFTEGAKKADAIASAFGERVVPINLNGVFGWRGQNEHGGKVVLPDLESVAINGREVILAFDSDAKTNKHIHSALQRFSRLLVARGARTVRLVALPGGAGAEKAGIDDYLASGKTIDDVLSLLVDLAVMQRTVRVPMGAHPDTGAALYLPGGYDVQSQRIVKIGPRGEVQPVYSGEIFVRSLGTDLGTGEEAATVQWGGASRGAITLLRAELASAKALRDRLAARGALVSDVNAKALAGYFAEFIAENAVALPRVAVSSRLGLHDGGALVLPQVSIGGNGPITYQSTRPQRVGDDPNAYPAALRDLSTWDDVSVTSLVIGLSLAAPLVARLRPRRNPALYLAGPSGSGKTTLCQFAVGIWGDPTAAPFRVEATRTTRAGYLQTLTELGGLPLFVDEAHTAVHPDMLEGLAYNFANGQTYTKGTTNGHAAGGEVLGGTLLLAGEARAEFKNSGSRNRVLWLDGGRFAPLGTDNPCLGASRAQTLERAWEAGAGQFGARFAEAVWRDWASISSAVTTLRDDHTLAAAHTPWRHTLAIAMQALRIAFELAGQPLESEAVPVLLEQWAALLVVGQKENDPAADAFEQIVLLVSSAQAAEPGDAPLGWEVRLINREPVAYRKGDEDFWRIPTGSQAFDARLGKSMPQLHGQTWIARGYVQAAADGKATHVDRIGPNARARVLRVPLARLEDWAP